ncbi:hypothetical protein AVEN_55729-1 [Araneus ventricosus]|uniref:Uncharacterized protein n=1 Tax=Araneus ventricosus TaxID=182803 RepID=A0A4Y2QFS7_ARAVE|nr:hypothetical protein AVEN_55729-1 [Araneus ventricosus]
MAALVSARLAKYLQKTFPWITSDHIFFWSDSQTTLHWINGDPLRWEEFVRNRVREIQEKTNRDHWNYCRGKTKPAVKLTRGLSIHVLVQDDVWWHGPDWLTSQNLSFNNSADSEINETDIADELTKNYVPVMTVTEHYRNDFTGNLLSITNDYTKLIRIISYVFRFAANCRFPESKKFRPVKADERVRAGNSLIRMVQEGKFQEEIKDLKREDLALFCYFDLATLSRCNLGAEEDVPLSQTYFFPFCVPVVPVIRPVFVCLCSCPNKTLCVMLGPLSG